MNKNKRTTYTIEFKLKAVKMYLDDGFGYKRACDILGIPDKKTLRLWVKNFNELGLSGLEERRGKSTSPLKGKSRTKPKTIEEENKILKMENEFLKKLLTFQRR